MFDIGFLELIVIGVIALIVLGPERLPKAARTLGLWVSKAKKSLNSIKIEIDRELKVQELQQQLEEEKSKLESHIKLSEVKEDLEETIEQTQNTINELNNEITNHSAISKESNK